MTSSSIRPAKTGGFIAFLALAFLAPGKCWTAPAGPPSPPASTGALPSGLDGHVLLPGPAALDNPLKGLMAYPPDPGTADKRRYPTSLTFRYFALNELMTGPDSYNWAPLENFLNQTAREGRQAVVRVYVEYPGEKSGIPDFLRKSGIAIRRVKQWNTESPDYDDPRTLAALTHFIKAWGARYDGDPRIGFITMGLVGLWGEWHTWPSPELFPTDDSVRQVLDAFAQSFHKTRLLVRYPHLARGYAVGLPMGFHDDSFAYRDSGGQPGSRSVTLPQSMGGWDWSFLQEMLNAGGENRWTVQPIGGELRPEIQTSFARPGKNIDDWRDCVAAAHASWLLDHVGVEAFAAGDKDMDALDRGLGYDLRVREAYFKNALHDGERLRLALRWSNEGVAPFYYPWPVLVGLFQGGKLVKAWTTGWDLRLLQPSKIRVFPDWNLKGKPKDMDFAAPRVDEASFPTQGLAPGSYRLALRVPNPLEALGFAKARPLRFSNAAQGADGWLTLGSLQLGAR
ncbi:MAG TPA: DUF4832 domain-containing protein [bacterium]|jgi:hypothetical protein|nr:DUF4832 domain-containing protein [bacterium]